MYTFIILYLTRKYIVFAGFFIVFGVDCFVATLLAMTGTGGRTDGRGNYNKKW